MTPILFLDFDGVLNYKDWIVENPANNWKVLNPYCVGLVNEIVDRSGCEVVISSSWRIGRDLDELQAILAAAGYRHGIRGVTPSLRGYRGHEIQKWLVDNGCQDSGFVILDDSDDMLPYMDRLVRTSFESGLTRDHVNRALTLFGCRDRLLEEKLESMK